MHYSETHGCLQAISCLPFSAHFADIVAFKDAIGNILLVMKGTRIWSCLFKKYSMAGLISSSFFLLKAPSDLRRSVKIWGPASMEILSSVWRNVGCTNDHGSYSGLKSGYRVVQKQVLTPREYI